MGNPNWQAFRPVFPQGKEGSALLCRVTRKLASLSNSGNHHERNESIELWRRFALKKRVKCPAQERQRLGAAIHLLADLAKQGWSIQASVRRVKVARPELENGENLDPRAQIRRQQLAERDAQLREPATVEFVREMEARRLFRDRFVSIFSLMRDGRQLAEKLRRMQEYQRDEEVVQLVSEVVQPYLQFVGENTCCSETGLRLVDIWRYFRHTWANAYKTIPGRSMMVLVRDAAGPNHPVIGIAALSSAAVAITARDEWIGWTPNKCLADIGEQPTTGLARWLQKVVDAALEEVYKLDFFEDEILRPQELRRPHPEVIDRLFNESRHQRVQHHDSMESKEYKKTIPPEQFDEKHWEAQARSPLFRSKRALELAQMLRVRMVLGMYFGKKPAKEGLIKLSQSREGREAIARILRKAKADRVGTAMADLTVCGAVPPYNELLGGKLVALLMTSPEVVAEYRRRYAKAPSIIASSMAGRAVTRPAHLVLVGTTSLYGQRPCQYDRIRFPCTLAGGDCIRYEYLGRTRGVGTSQFSKKTVEALTLLLQHSARGQQVNSVFGEGVNPRLRKLRDGLVELGLDADEFLRHGRPRIVYGVALAGNMRPYLLGKKKRPKYFLPQKSKRTTEQMCRWWMERWLLGRLRRDDVLERMSRHTLVHPIRHGARVVLPRTDIEQQVFEEWAE